MGSHAVPAAAQGRRGDGQARVQHRLVPAGDHAPAPTAARYRHRRAGASHAGADGADLLPARGGQGPDPRDGFDPDGAGRGRGAGDPVRLSLHVPAQLPAALCDEPDRHTAGPADLRPSGKPADQLLRTGSRRAGDQAHAAGRAYPPVSDRAGVLHAAGRQRAAGLPAGAVVLQPQADPYDSGFRRLSSRWSSPVCWCPTAVA